MSPASHGNLQVERFIGSYLISNFNRPGCQTKGNKQISYANYANGYVISMPSGYSSGTGGWAGLPLISMSNRNSRCGKTKNNQQRTGDVTCSIAPPVYEEFSHSPLSRLAVHTHGAPLILRDRFNNRKGQQQGITRHNKSGVSARIQHESKVKVISDNTTVVSPSDGRNVDSISVTSDESFGSGNSEGCLPRIIKPRKRRKKDRKPPTAIETAEPHLVRSFDGNEPPTSGEHVSNDLTKSPFDNETTYRSQKYLSGLISSVPVHTSNIPVVSVKNLDHQPTVLIKFELDVPNLEHDFEDLDESDSEKGTPSLCQCRYCDPQGQIWDVEQSCYSPVLTHPTDELFELEHSLRSWSDPARNVGVGCFLDPNKFCDFSNTTCVSVNMSNDDTIKGFSDDFFEQPAPPGVGVIGGGRRSNSLSASSAPTKSDLTDSFVFSEMVNLNEKRNFEINWCDQAELDQILEQNTNNLQENNNNLVNSKMLYDVNTRIQTVCCRLYEPDPDIEKGSETLKCFDMVYPSRGKNETC